MAQPCKLGRPRAEGMGAEKRGVGAEGCAEGGGPHTLVTRRGAGVRVRRQRVRGLPEEIKVEDAEDEDEGQGDKWGPLAHPHVPGQLLGLLEVSRGACFQASGLRL